MDIENSLRESDFQSDPDEISSHMSDTDTICDSELDVVEFLYVADDETDPVCRRLDKLIRNGNISKDQISYKYLDHMIQIYYDSKHSYDKDVINFFASIVLKVVKVCIILFVDRWVLVTDKVLQRNFHEPGRALNRDS